LAHGVHNEEFERKFASYIGVKHAITMNSCTSALFISIMQLGIKREVIVPSFTFVASVNAIVTAGAIPVFADVDYHTRNITAKNIEPLINDSTEAIMVVHYGGHPCKMDEIMQLAQKHGLAVIEDCAESIGAKFNGLMVGSIGNCGCFSFFPTKNITTGEGGMFVTNDDSLAAAVRTSISHGISKDTLKRSKLDKPWLREAIMPGYNFRMCNILAALGNKQMDRIDFLNDKRREHSFYLNDRLKGLGIDLPIEEPYAKHTYQMYTICVDKNIRDSLLVSLRSQGIQASVHFDPPVHLQDYYLKHGFVRTELPVTEKLSKSIITLPMFPS
jgi:perosamine synthetase